MADASPNMQKINCARFYQNWSGHPIADLTTFRDLTLSSRNDKPIIWLAGDSSLDNKEWVPSPGPGGEDLPVEAPDIYNHTLDRAKPKPDVAFWMNHFLESHATCINTAVEETMLRERDDKLNEHDAFIRDNIRSQDVLIVSVGGNDVALKPSLATIRNMLQMAWLTKRANIENGTASALPYFADLFGPRVQAYVDRMVEKTKPRAVIICMIYYPLEAFAGQSSWAATNLFALGYNRDPGQLQAAIRQMYEMATSKIRIEGTTVLPCKLFEVLDGKRKEEYTARVEPSVEGGRKMAEKFVQMLREEGVLGA